MRRIALTLAATAVLALPATAAAGTPVQVGTGGEPEIAVDPSGRAHVAWHASDAPARTLYCQVPRGATGPGCVEGETFPAPAGQGVFDRPHVALTSASGGVAVVRRTCCGPDAVNALFSTDGGATFGGPTPLAVDGDGGASPVELGGDLAFVSGRLIWVNTGLALQSWSSGSPVNLAASLFSGGVRAGALVVAPPNLAMISEDTASTLRIRSYDGSGDFNAEANYSAPSVIPTGPGVHDPNVINGAGDPVLVRREGDALVARPAAGAADSTIDADAPGTFDAWGTARGASMWPGRGRAAARSRGARRPTASTGARG